MPSLGPAPKHLLAFSWYLPHQAWLKSQELDYYDCDGAEANKANLSWANLREAELSGAKLSGANLSGANLREAELSGADLRRAELSGADLRGADLSGADLRRAELSGADLRGANLSGAELSGANLREAELSGANLREAELSGANLSGAELSGANLSGANLRRAELSGANLSGANLRRAINNDESIPVIADIHKQVYEAASKPDCLDMSTWHHSCGTAHCRAGWVVTLAGEAGKALEDKYDTSYAATLIYLKSDPTLEKVPDFYCDNQNALDDMKRLAGV